MEGSSIQAPAGRDQIPGLADRLKEVVPAEDATAEDATDARGD
ncbi:MAG: hypothetical protein N2C14_27560 [Planctomycetales bacterium]